MSLIDDLIEIKLERNPEWAVDQLMEMLIHQMAQEEDHQLNIKLLQEVIEKNRAMNLEMKAQMIEIERLSVTDTLTQLYNRKKMTEVIRENIAMFERYERPCSLIMFDIDHFKMVNDTFGHNMGDEVLRMVSSLSKESLRQVDWLARWGGEEFLILLTDTSLKGAYTTAEKLRVLFETSVFPHGNLMTCSFGISTIMPLDTLESLVDRADQNLYTAKKTGRNKVCPVIGTTLDERFEV